MTLTIQTKYSPTWHIARPVTLTNGKLAYVRSSDRVIFEAWEVAAVRAEVFPSATPSRPAEVAP